MSFGLPGCYRLRGTAITPRELDQLLDELPSVVPLAEVELALAEGRKPPAGAVLTFDDGYREHLDLVAPLLTAKGLEATFYLTSGHHAAAERVHAVDAWYWLLDHAHRPAGVLRLPGGGSVQFRLDRLSGKKDLVRGPAKQLLLESSIEQQQRMVGSLVEAVDVALPADLAKDLYMTRAGWGRLAAMGHRVGAHGLTHQRLTQLTPEAVIAEVATSMALAREPVSFSYPDGAMNDQVVSVLRGAGVVSAVTCEPGRVTRDTFLLRLPRQFVRPDDCHPGVPAGHGGDR